METNCIILAGGKSVRLGRDKISERLGTVSLLEHVISSIELLCRRIIIVTAGGRRFEQFADRPEITVVSDIIPDQGSLGGIYTGLVISDTPYNLVLAADMPFLCRPLLLYMFEVADGYDFVLPRLDSLYEPLHAIYSRNCISPIEAILSQGEKTIIELFKYVNVRYIEVPEIDRFDPEHLSFFNINTPEDLEKAKIIASGGKKSGC